MFHSFYYYSDILSPNTVDVLAITAGNSNITEFDIL